MIPSDITPKLAKLLPLLASNHDGEVVAAARAIVRTLTAAGSDLHALAVALEPSPFDWRDLVRQAIERASAEPIRPQVDPDAPEAPSKRWGLPIWGVKKVEPWAVVAGHCLQLDWTIPKAVGGKFLTKDERQRLKKFEQWRTPVTNADAEWIEATVAKCHAARDAWRSRPKAEPAPSEKVPA